ncbi:MAG TPA: NAD-dependent malic enzyme [Desulfomonilaceae bacterium]|nr:NAD-dependent malic enzyme [Desulfomonilaceae bacterium]
MRHYHTNPSHSFTVRLIIQRKPGMLGRITSTIGKNGGLMGAITIVSLERGRIVRDLIVYSRDQDHSQKILDAVRKISGITMLEVKDRTFEYHRGGKIQVEGRRPLEGPDDLAIAYTPGVGRVSLALARDPDSSYEFTMKGNSVAVVTDGSAVLGLGNLGPIAALPVMEGKALLFKKLAGVNAFPICLDVTEPDAIVSVVKSISPAFGGINLEDICAPRCFDIERRLQRELDIPVFHDDQHGTAIAVLAALTNGLKLVNKRIANTRIVVSGTGAAGVACIRMLLEAGARHIVACDSKGVIYPGREGMNRIKEELAAAINPDGSRGSAKDALKGADVFIGVSVADILKPHDLKVMAKDAIVFALANPVPEVDPEGAAEYVRIVATGRSDFPNQINNVLVFPGIFRGALDSRARQITLEMKMAAARAIADLVPDEELSEDLIVPRAFDPLVSRKVAEAVRNAVKQKAAAA